ncbi:hypothetical protein [Halalkalibacter akibai]|uniref:hypothetical protein n=1 Tax=Halalkalibacter akibai TaxID=1411 RepID=UPI000550EEA0|nr:hypothetical protein [Halalkalibacter akibai]
MKSRKWIYAICIIAIISIASFGAYKWFNEGELRLDTFIFLAVITAYLLNYMANGRTELEDQNEREVFLSKKALGLSYLILVICLGVTLIISEGTEVLSEFKNIPLVICFSLSIVIYPLVRAIVFLNQR